MKWDFLDRKEEEKGKKEKGSGNKSIEERSKSQAGACSWVFGWFRKKLEIYILGRLWNEGKAQ